MFARSPSAGPGCYRGWPRKPSSRPRAIARSERSSRTHLDRGESRRDFHLQGRLFRDTVHKRYLLHVAPLPIGGIRIVRQLMIGAGCPARGFWRADVHGGIFLLLTPHRQAMLVALGVSATASMPAS